MLRAPLVFALAATFAVAGCATRGPAADSTCAEDEVVRGPERMVAGGAVEGVPPRVVSFAGSLAEADDSGRFVETFTAVLFDANGESDLAGALVRLLVDGPESRSVSHTVSRQSVNETREPPFSRDGFKVWSAERGDGFLLVRAGHTFRTGSPPGNYSITLEVTPPDGANVRSLPDITLVRTYTVSVNGTREPPAFAAPLYAPLC